MHGLVLERAAAARTGPHREGAASGDGGDHALRAHTTVPRPQSITPAWSSPLATGATDTERPHLCGPLAFPPERAAVQIGGDARAREFPG